MGTPILLRAPGKNGHDSSENSTLWPELLGCLVDRHAANLGLYARQLCDCAEDVVQEALIELVEQTPPPEDTVAWLYRVVRNKAISASRSAQRRKRHEAEAAGRRPRWFVQARTDLMDAQVATTALQSLPLEQREVVVAHIWGGLSFEQIGQLVGVSDSAAHRRYQAAILALRQKLRIPCPKIE